jgi:hypothetical protein
MGLTNGRLEACDTAHSPPLSLDGLRRRVEGRRPVQLQPDDCFGVSRSLGRTLTLIGPAHTGGDELVEYLDRSRSWGM